METNKIYQGDCLDLFETIPDESVDMAFADPPFNLRKKYNAYNDDMGFEDYMYWCEQWLPELVRVVKPSGSIFVHNIPYWLSRYVCFLEKIAFFKHWIAWDAASGAVKNMLQPSHYGILYYGKTDFPKFYPVRHPNKRCRHKICNRIIKDYGGKKTTIPPFGPLISDCWTDVHRIKHNKYRDKHPCQLPIHLLERIILMSTDENDIVLDPFMGTGTTALASKRLGRQYLGFEISQEYVDCANAKLSQESTLTKIGSSWISIFEGQRGKNKVVTIRDCDWPDLTEHFEIPKLPQEVDFTEIHLKSTKPKRRRKKVVDKDANKNYDSSTVVEQIPNKEQDNG